MPSKLQSRGDEVEVGEEEGQEKEEEEEEEGYQDDHCSTINAQERTGTKLCNACVKIFQPRRKRRDHASEDKLRNYRHIRFFDTLQRSASRGCELCSYVLRRQRARETEHALPQELNMVYALVEFCDHSLSCQASPQEYVQSDLDCLRILFTYDTHADSTTTLTFNAFLIAKDETYLPNRARSTRATPNIDLFGTWMRDCLVNHTKCTRFYDTGYIPSRLLEISSDADDVCVSVRLIETSEQVLNLPYMALSHCWGDCDFLNLTTNNRSRLLSGFDTAELPETFQDAIRLTHCLGAEYLWIDSICIVQDSDSDWEKEAFSMKKVYSNAMCTIAATRAQNSWQGLHRSEGDANDLCHTPIEVSWSFSSTRVLFLVEDIRGMDISDSPLLKRAWVIQEMALSPRKLHFAKSQVHWQCQERVACEAFPNQYPSSMLLDQHLYQWPVNRGVRDSKSLSAAWWGLVHAYSSGSLTENTDKYAALAGVAEQFQIISGGLTYTCGMWRENMPSDLLWCASAEAHANTKSSRRLKRYRAPSWSWLSLDDTSIRHPPVDHLYERCLVEVLDVAVENPGHNTFGSINAAALQIRGLLKVVGIVKFENEGRVFHLWFHDHSCLVMLDGDNEDTASSVYCMPFYGHESFPVVGLLLKPAVDGGSPDRVCRIGYFEADASEKSSRFFTYQDHDGIWKPLQPTTVTLV